MHRAVLQNDDYIKFANDNTVEVLALGRLEEGISKGDPKAGTYKGKDKDGNEVEYMLSWPGLTKDEILALRSSKAASYNDTGGIPYTSFVDPHTLKKMRGVAGGQSSKKVMEMVEIVKEEMNTKYGPSLKRSELEKFNEGADEAKKVLADKGAGKAMSKVKALIKKWEKKSKALADMGKALHEQVLEKASEELDKAEELIGEGDVKGGKKILSGLKTALRKTRLEARWKEVFEKTKAGE